MENLKFSIITPEHDLGNLLFLTELYQSLKTQTYNNWEWILYLNNGITKENLPELIVDDAQVKIYETSDTNTSIGYIKKMAFSLGTGDVLVEVDHDDMLTPDCLEELSRAYIDPSVGFVFSDAAMLHMKGEFSPYDPLYGWTYKSFNWRGKELISMNHFPPTSHSICLIYFAPDHIRSWRTSVYKQIGGHNPELDVCDDHELCIRTYLATKMVHIPKVLYIYRITGENTSFLRNEAIQIKTRELRDQYARLLAEKDAKDKGLFCIDIGSGHQPYPGYKTVDIKSGADYVYDLNNGIPLPDNSVGVLNASHIIEHLHDKNKTMSEIHRVLAPGGWAFIEVPSTDGRGAFQDPTHVSYWNENSFLYYTKKYLADFIDNDTIKFQEYRKETWYPNDWLKSLNVLITTVWLVAVKPGMPRLPGMLEI